MRTPSHPVFMIAGLFILANAVPRAYAADSKLAPGLSVGIAYTPDDDFDGLGWTASGSLEGVVGKVAEVRGKLGFLSLQADIDGQHPDAKYWYLLGEVLGADLVSPTGGIGLYNVDLEEPITDDGQSSLEFGVHVGVRVLLPYHDGEHAFTADGTVHHVFADGPSAILTFGVGWLF